MRKMKVSGNKYHYILCSGPNTSGSYAPIPSYPSTHPQSYPPLLGLRNSHAEVFGHLAQTSSQTWNPAEQGYKCAEYGHSGTCRFSAKHFTSATYLYIT